MALASHIELPDRYRVARHIASGGMASVWETEDLLLGRTVAVKVLSPHFAADPGARARFEREARTAARVSDHPHVATIYDTGDHAGDVYIVMEYFPKGTVADRLRTAREAGERVPRDTALRWLREAAAGLDVAHAAGIVHRDVKPANLLLDERERLAVADFGIARLADDTQMTNTGMVLGTAAYLSPEQAIGGPATAASDRYALAVVAYELLTGVRPFPEGPPAAQLRQHAAVDPPPASQAVDDLPAAFDAALARGLAKDPAQRPATATALVDELERALAAPIARVQPPERTLALPVPTPRRQTPTPPPRPAPPLPGPDRGPGGPAAVAGGRSARRSLSPVALIAIVALLVGGAVAFAVSAGGTGDGDRTADKKPTATNSAGQRTQAREPATAAQPPPPQTQAAAPPAQASTKPAGNPRKLNQQGDQLNKAGRYAEAVAPLQAAVEAYQKAGDTSSLDYGYALYNYGVALNRSGNPQAAIDVLSQRLLIKDQTATVRRELKDAERRLAGGGEPKPAGGSEGDD